MAPPGRLSAKAAERLFGEAVAAFRRGDFTPAERGLNRLREAFPDHADVCHLLGVVRLAQGRPGDAIAPLDDARTQAERGRPDILPGVLSALGSALRRSKRPREAVPVLERAAGLAPDDADIHFNLGQALLDARDPRRAGPAFETAARLKPDDPEILLGLGEVLLQIEAVAPACDLFRDIVARDPGRAKAHAGLAKALLLRNDLAGARAALDRVLALDPGNADARVDLCRVMTEIGDSDGAFVAMSEALKHRKGPLDELHSGLVYQMNYSARCSAADILREARAWNARHATPLAGRARPFAQARDPGRRLNVGYIGGDFITHPVGYFTLALFAAHDPAQVETFAYMTRANADSLTARLRADAHHWRDVAHLTDAELAEAIRADGIDILVSMAGHTAHSRLLAFAERPAPVQAAGFGIAGTTGMDAMDYILADRFEIPPGYERFYSEAVVRLPNDNICYVPPEVAPEVAPLPACAEGAVTFGCFNNIAKASPEAVALWARVLAAVPGARILLKTHSLKDEGCRARYLGLFAENGIGADRLILEGPAPHAELLAAYGRVDIALDPLPYSGGLTTLEALWMGVPVVTLPGETFASRHSSSHLANAGLPELIARDADDYVAIARRLAGDTAVLADLRAGLRARLAASPICDGRAYARGLEAAYRTMWQTWHRGEAPRGFDVPS